MRVKPWLIKCAWMSCESEKDGKKISVAGQAQAVTLPAFKFEASIRQRRPRHRHGEACAAMVQSLHFSHSPSSQFRAQSWLELE